VPRPDGAPASESQRNALGAFRITATSIASWRSAPTMAR
jgi:hypothetical protein